MLSYLIILCLFLRNTFPRVGIYFFGIICFIFYLAVHFASHNRLVNNSQYFIILAGNQTDRRKGRPPMHPYGRREPWDQGDPMSVAGRPPSGRAGSAVQTRGRAQQLAQMEREVSLYATYPSLV